MTDTQHRGHMSNCVFEHVVSDTVALKSCEGVLLGPGGSYVNRQLGGSGGINHTV